MKTSILYMTAAISLFTLTACNETQTQFVTAEEEDGIVRALDKTPLQEVTREDLAGQTTTCRNDKICVEICHRPPGNPENSKTMRLPLAAQLAHLNHGTDAHEHDYLGPCDPVEPPVTEPEPPSEEEVLPGEGTEPLPPWCAAILDIDSNCDGYIDESGEPIF